MFVVFCVSLHTNVALEQHFEKVGQLSQIQLLTMGIVFIFHRGTTNKRN